MIIDPNLNVTVARDAVVGELLYVPRSTGRLLALVLMNKTESQNLVVGVLQWGKMEAAQPFHTLISKKLRCLTLGVGWLLEPLPDEETTPHSRRYAYSSGALHFDEGGTKIMFAQHPSDYEHSEFSFNLQTGEREEAGQSAAPCRSWRIWSHPAERNRTGANPIFEFTASPTT